MGVYPRHGITYYITALFDFLQSTYQKLKLGFTHLQSNSTISIINGVYREYFTPNVMLLVLAHLEDSKWAMLAKCFKWKNEQQIALPGL